MNLQDELVSNAIGVAEENLQGESEKEKTSIGGGILRFFISAIWLIITLAVSLIALYGMAFGMMADILGSDLGMVLCFGSIGLSFVIFLITFIVPYLRKKGTLTRWCGIVALGDALWWIYIFISNR